MGEEERKTGVEKVRKIKVSEKKGGKYACEPRFFVLVFFFSIGTRNCYGSLNYEKKNLKGWWGIEV